MRLAHHTFKNLLTTYEDVLGNMQGVSNSIRQKLKRIINGQADRKG